MNATSVTTTLTDSVTRLVAIVTQTENATRSESTSKMMRRAYKAFAADNKIWVESLFDEHFLVEHGEPVVADYVDELLTRHQAAIDLALAWETHLVSPNVKVSKQCQTNAVKAAESFLAYLPV